MMPVRILRAGVPARQFCRNNTCATVEAVFERSFYLRAGDDFVCVGEPDIGNGPLTLVGHLGRIDLHPKQRAEVCEQFILIDGRIRLSLERGETWRPSPWPVCRSPARLPEICTALARSAAVDAPDEGLARIAHPRVVAFERWMSDVIARATPSGDAVRNLLGLGPGLTPSGDDFLVGALAALDAIGERAAHAALARAIVDALPGATSPLSACFLRAAAAGHVGESLHVAVSAVIEGDIGAAMVAADSIGHSSGWDMLAGIITALRLAAPARETHAVA